MYSGTCNATDVIKCKRMLFVSGASIESISPTSAGLKRHILRVVLQATKCCRCSEKQRIELIHLTEAGKKLTTNIYHFRVN